MSFHSTLKVYIRTRHLCLQGQFVPKLRTILIGRFKALFYPRMQNFILCFLRLPSIFLPLIKIYIQLRPMLHNPEQVQYRSVFKPIHAFQHHST